MTTLAETIPLWEKALDGGGFVGISLLLAVLVFAALAKFIIFPALKILREMTENCTRAAADNKEAGSQLRIVASDLKGTARILEKVIQRSNGDKPNDS